MQPQRISESTKQNSSIQIGKTTQRIRDDHLDMLRNVQLLLGYGSMEEMLFITSFYGASMALLTGVVTLFNAQNRSGGQG